MFLCHLVSVPYRGATFLNRYSWCTWWNDRKFPSPIGELHFSIGMSNLFNVPVKVSVPYRGATFLNSLWFSHYIVDHCFRPLSGSYISQWSFWNERVRCCLFPSPIGELHFSIKIRFYRSAKKPVSVPYRGATFLNSPFLFSVYKHYKVSVPYRGATFLNLYWYRLILRYRVSVPYRGATFLNTISATPCPVWDE